MSGNPETHGMFFSFASQLPRLAAPRLSGTALQPSAELHKRQESLYVWKKSVFTLQ